MVNAILRPRQRDQNLVIFATEFTENERVRNPMWETKKVFLPGEICFEVHIVRKRQRGILGRALDQEWFVPSLRVTTDWSFVCGWCYCSKSHAPCLWKEWHWRCFMNSSSPITMCLYHSMEEKKESCLIPNPMHRNRLLMRPLGYQLGNILLIFKY